MGGNESFVRFMDDHFENGHNKHTNEPSHHIVRNLNLHLLILSRIYTCTPVCRTRRKNASCRSAGTSTIIRRVGYLGWVGLLATILMVERRLWTDERLVSLLRARFLPRYVCPQPSWQKVDAQWIQLQPSMSLVCRFSNRYRCDFRGRLARYTLTPRVLPMGSHTSRGCG